MKKIFYSFLVLALSLFIVLPKVNADYDDVPKPGLSYGYYMNDSNLCKLYPWIPNVHVQSPSTTQINEAKNTYGFCVEQGVEYNRYTTYSYQGNDEVNGACANTAVLLGCTQYAASYYGAVVNKNDFWGAQSYLNGRTYFTTDSCLATATHDAARLRTINYANSYCNTEPNFGSTILNIKVGDSETFTDSNGVFQYYNYNNANQTNYTITKNNNSLTITGLAKTTGNTQLILSRGSRNSTTIYCSNTSQNYIVSKDGPLKNTIIYINIYEETTPTVEYNSFNILKEDDEDSIMEGVVFKIGTNLNGIQNTDWKFLTTDQNGRITITNIPYGTKYYYQEYSTLPGYVLDTTVYSEVIGANSHIPNIVTNHKEEVEEIPYGVIKVFKEDQFNNKLSGVKFKIGINPDLSGAEGTDWDYYTTNDFGLITISKTFDTYYIQEIELPQNIAAEYTIDNNIYEVTLNENETTKEIVIKNIKNIDRLLQIFKIDATTNKALKGVKINIYKKDGTLYYEGTTNEEGLINLTTIVDGEYYLQEMEAPSGYEKITTKHDFEISETTPEVYVTLENQIKNTKTGELFIVIPFGIVTIFGISTYLILKRKQKLI